MSLYWGLRNWQKWGLRCAAAVLWAAGGAAQAQSPTQAQLQARLQQAQQDPALGQRLYGLGQKVAHLCAHCHGPHKSREFLEVPYLEGQNPAYLVEQIRQFSQGERKNAFMEGILKAMNRDEMVGMVLFYAKQSLPARAPQDVALYERGKAYYQRICIHCHAGDGRGNERLPRIAGQHQGYVQMTLTQYRQGSSARSDPNMALVTRSMSDQDIAAVAAYLEAMD